MIAIDGERAVQQFTQAERPHVHGCHERLRETRRFFLRRRSSPQRYYESKLYTVGVFQCGRLFRLACAAEIVRAMSSPECAIETNTASNCEGARKTPWSSMAEKKAAYRRVSESFASA